MEQRRWTNTKNSLVQEMTKRNNDDELKEKKKNWATNTNQKLKTKINRYYSYTHSVCFFLYVYFLFFYFIINKIIAVVVRDYFFFFFSNTGIIPRWMYGKQRQHHQLQNIHKTFHSNFFVVGLCSVHITHYYYCYYFCLLPLRCCSYIVMYP